MGDLSEVRHSILQESFQGHKANKSTKVASGKLIKFTRLLLPQVYISSKDC